jgi:hypothetical protein
MQPSALPVADEKMHKNRRATTWFDFPFKKMYNKTASTK